jgi:hypothetical protein
VGGETRPPATDKLRVGPLDLNEMMDPVTLFWGISSVDLVASFGKLF